MKNKLLRLLSLGLTIMVLTSACGEAKGPGNEAEKNTTSESENLPSLPTEDNNPTDVHADRNGHGGRGPNQGGGMFSGPENDEDAKAVLAVCAPKFGQYTFTDPDTGFELEYSLYIPESWDGNEKLPLVQFMPDSTGTGRSAADLVENYYGAAVWASDADQERHPSFVLVPAYSETLADDNWKVSTQLETGVKLLQCLVKEYNLDENRLYTTGQSGGCMASLYLSSVYPDLFAASLYVSGQWDNDVLGYLTDYPFIYVTAGGDEKATGGQTEVMSLLDNADIPYSYGEWDATATEEEQNAEALQILNGELKANFIRFTPGTVAGVGAVSTNEHMASFNYAYKISAVRDWLFEQLK